MIYPDNKFIFACAGGSKTTLMAKTHHGNIVDMFFKAIKPKKDMLPQIFTQAAAIFSARSSTGKLEAEVVLAVNRISCSHDTTV